MTTKDAREQGSKHCEDGKQLTPYDCREFDTKLFAFLKGSERWGREYAKLRGAFNRGWSGAHAAGRFDIANQ